MLGGFVGKYYLNEDGSQNYLTLELVFKYIPESTCYINNKCFA